MAEIDVTEIGGDAPTNGAQDAATAQIPYIAEVTVEGVTDLLFHRWNVEAVEAKGNAAKGSKDKKSDNLESYIYRTPTGELALPGEYLRMAIVAAAKFRQDPRSPRKSAMDLYKAAVIPLTALASLGKSKWDYEDKRRVVVQRAGITRTRPALKSGWRATVQFQIQLPQYVAPHDLAEVLRNAGQLIGVGDFRPTYGRFMVQRFEVLQLS
jgi:hypothetical protein